MDSSPREEAALAYERAAAELEIAARHLRTAAQHMREREVPRACAHAFAALGHLANSDDQVKHAAKLHASKAVP